MLTKKLMNKLDISVVVPMYNAAATINECLESLVDQNYPIKEVIVIDNRSSDDSVRFVEKFKFEHRELLIKILVQKENKGLLPSYIRGAEEAKSRLVVMMHSDSVLPTNSELRQLVAPFEKEDALLVAACPKVCHPASVWRTYNFWQKLIFAPVVNLEPHGLNAKFDCFRKDVFLRVAEVWQNRYDDTNEAGGEDWDLHGLLKAEGKIVATEARVNHLHYFSGSFTLKALIAKRQHVAKSYGKLLRLYGWGLGLKGLLAFLLRPVLAIGSLLPGIQLAVAPLLVSYAFFYSRRMFTDSKTVFDPKILLVPLVNIFLVYYETYWMLKIFLKKPL